MFTREYDENNPMNGSVGIANGVMLSLLIWALLILMILYRDSISQIPMHILGLWFEIHGYKIH